MSVIKFGTDGWRAKMGGDFSFRNVRIFSQAYANYLKRKYKDDDNSPSVVVNYDTRFLSEEFAFEAAKIFSLNGIRTFMPERDTPLAPISLAIISNKCQGGVNFTASFNKPVYNGIKVFTGNGSPALPGETAAIEKEAREIAGDYCFKPQYSDNSLISHLDVKTPYIEYVEELVDFKLIKDSGVRVIVDNLYGTSREYLDYILAENDIDTVSIHNYPYSAFGGVISSCGRETLRDLAKLVVQQKAHLGLATDIDGDRFGVVDSRGRFLNSNTIMPPLIEYLIEVRNMSGGIVKSISTTNNIRGVAEHYSREVYTTPVGFKYLADVLTSKQAFIAVESSNGASLNTSVRIKDGILFSLLITEMIAYYGLETEKILKDFYLRFPRLYSREAAVNKNEKTMDRYGALLARETFDFKGWELDKIEYIDGVKFTFKNGWLLIRQSGTNDLFRIYAESTGLAGTRQLIKMGRSFIE
jgi:phosphoglucomutase